MASGSSGELTRGVQDHCTGATRRGGHVTEPWVAHAGRRRRAVRGHVAGGHATTRVHVGAHVGRHVAGGDGNWRAHGYSGALVKEGAVTQLIHICAPYLSAFFPNISSVWDYVPHDTYLCKTRGSIRAVESKRKALIAWTQVHAIIT